MAAIFIFDRDDDRQFKDLMACRLVGNDLGLLAKREIAAFASFREDVMNMIHLLWGQELTFFALMPYLSALLAFTQPGAFRLFIPVFI